MTKGEVVTVRLYGGTTAERRVVAEKGDVVVICSEAEYQNAQRESREPSGVGFPREDVIEGVASKKRVSSQHMEPGRGSMTGD